MHKFKKKFVKWLFKYFIMSKAVKTLQASEKCHLQNPTVF